MKLVEHLENGHTAANGHRFEGTFHLLITDADGTRRTLEIQARMAK
jgi:hypothetical protein